MQETENALDTIREFNRLYHESEVWENRTFFLGIPVKKAPTDLWLYQELISKVRPQAVVETGTYVGGSAAWMLGCMLLSRIESPLVVTVDLEQRHELRTPEIVQLVGSSTEIATQNAIENLVAGKSPVMVVLDSDHNAHHVLDEMVMYAPLVTTGSYLIVEDTNLNGHPIRPGAGPGPMEAVKEFLSLEEGAAFEVDETCHKFLLTFNPSGYLRKVR